MICRITKGSKYLEIIVLLFMLTSVCSLVARAEEPVTEENMDTSPSIEKLDNQSNPESKAEVGNPVANRDPFKPFIKIISEQEEETGTGSLVPPIKRYELQEFRIAGILWIEGEPRAMVVDPEKNTYYLAVGDEIGNKGGVILEIRNSGILVKETRHYEDLFGEDKVEVRKVVLSFQE
ncbi:MAG: pilus assembly protein PilP [Thermodesulfobacteriota bacterium]